MAGNVVVDSCVAVKWVIEQSYSSEALDRLNTWQSQGIRILVPPIFPSEVGNTLLKYVRGDSTMRPEDRLALHEAMALFEVVIGIVNIDHDASLVGRAMELCVQWHRPSVYDATFVALAERQGCDLWTADSKFFRAVQSHVSLLKHI
ncbi:MAG: type II toxin-antitoxin system VapC family toxin [Chloroflexota bacterium]